MNCVNGVKIYIHLYIVSVNTSFVLCMYNDEQIKECILYHCLYVTGYCSACSISMSARE